MPTFGNANIGSNGSGAAAGWIYGGRFYLSEAALVSKLTWYLFAPSYSNDVRALIYSDNGGEPDALLAYKELYITAVYPAGWNDFEFDVPVSLSAGYYWLAIQFEASGFTYYYAGSGGTSAVNTGATWGTGPTDPFGTHIDLTLLYSVYATYTEAAAYFVGRKVW